MSIRSLRPVRFEEIEGWAEDDMVAALRAKGLPVAYVAFPGEGHGFRQAAHVERALSCEYAF